MISFLCGLFKRSFLYQFIFVFAYLKSRDFSKSSYEFKDKFYELTTSLNFRHSAIDQIFANPLLIFQIFIGIQVFCSLLAFLGVRFFSFLAGVFLIIGNLVYNNPIKSFKAPLSLASIPLEFLVLFTLSLGMLTQAFGRSCCKTKTIEEAGQTETPDAGKREAKVPSKKEKKRI